MMIPCRDQQTIVACVDRCRVRKLIRTATAFRSGLTVSVTILWLSGEVAMQADMPRSSTLFACQKAKGAISVGSVFLLLLVVSTR